MRFASTGKGRIEIVSFGDEPNRTYRDKRKQLAVLFGLLGAMLGVGLVYTGRLALPIGFHIAWNFFQGGVFGFPVSGGDQQVALLTVDDRGPALWTGGAYGPEGGLLGGPLGHQARQEDEEGHVEGVDELLLLEGGVVV